MTNFSIDSDAGRVGEFWWINSDQRAVLPVLFGVVGKRWIRWGTFGFGRDVRIYMEPIDG